MEWTTIVSVMFGAVIAVGAVFFLYQLYSIVGLKHPRLWGFLSLGNNTGGGLLVYLIRRRNCPVVNITDNDRQEISKRKKATGIGLCFVCLGTIGIIICQIML